MSRLYCVPRCSGDTSGDSEGEPDMGDILPTDLEQFDRNRDDGVIPPYVVGGSTFGQKWG